MGDARPPNCTAIDQETSEGAPKNYGIFVRTDFWCQISRFSAGKTEISSPWCKEVESLKIKNSILGNLTVFLHAFGCIGTMLCTRICPISILLKVELVTAQKCVLKLGTQSRDQMGNPFTDWFRNVRIHSPRSETSRNNETKLHRLSNHVFEDLDSRDLLSRATPHDLRTDWVGFDRVGFDWVEFYWVGFEWIGSHRLVR